MLDRIPAFIALAPDPKKYINMGASVVLALIAFALVTYVPASIYSALAPWFQVVSGVIVIYSAQQVVHGQSK